MDKWTRNRCGDWNGVRWKLWPSSAFQRERRKKNRLQGQKLDGEGERIKSGDCLERDSYKLLHWY